MSGDPNDPLAGVDLSQYAPDAPTSTAPPVVVDPSDPLHGIDTSQYVPDASKAPQAIDYNNVGWGDVFKRGAGNFLPDAGSAAVAIPHAVMNPSETWEGVKSIGRGAGAQMGLTEAASPNDQAAFSAAAAPYSAAWQAIRHGDTAPLKEQVAEHPANLMLSYAPIATGGAGALGKLATGAEAAGAAAPVVSGTNAVGKGLGYLGKAASVADPVQDAAWLAGKAGPAATLGMSALSGKPANAFGTAYNAGVAGGDALQTFKDFASGNQGPLDLSARASAAIKAVKNDATNEWANTKQGLAEANKGSVPLTNTQIELQKQWGKLGDPALAFDPTAHNQLLDAWDTIAAHGNAAPGDPAASLQGIDRLKQRLYDVANAPAQPPEARNALMSVHNAIGQDLRAHAPAYGQLMDQYQELKDNFNDLSKTLGTGDKVTASAEMGKFLRAQKTPSGQNLIDQLAEKDPTLPYAVSGAALRGGTGSSWLANMAELGGAYHGVTTGNPWTAAAAAGAYAFGHSPALQQGLPVAAGVASRAAPAIGTAYRAAQPAALATQREETTPVREMTVHKKFPPAPAAPFKRGGSVRSAHQGLVDRLMREVEKAKRAEKGRTSVLLRQPDEAVAAALRHAQAAI